MGELVTSIAYRVTEIAVMPDLILAAGMPRSGSTWLYNALRLLLTRQGTNHACWIGDCNPPLDPHVDTLLMKLHDYNAPLALTAIRIFTCHRDLRDLVASADALGVASSPADQVALADAAREAHDDWAPLAALDVPFEQIRDQPGDVVLGLADRLDLRLPLAATRAIVRRLDTLTAPTDGLAVYDPLTLLHYHHRSPTPAAPLSAEVEWAITERHGDWLAVRGYLETAEAVNG